MSSGHPGGTASDEALLQAVAELRNLTTLGRDHTLILQTIATDMARMASASSGSPPPAPIPPGGTPPTPASGAGSAGVFAEVVTELRRLNANSSTHNSLLASMYQVLQTRRGGDEHDSGMAISGGEGEFPRRYSGVEGKYRYFTAGGETFQRSAEAVAHAGRMRSYARKTRLGRGILRGIDKYRKFREKPFQRQTQLIGRRIGGVFGQNSARVTGNVGKVFGDLVQLGGALAMSFVKVRDATDRWTENAMRKARQLAEVSPSMASIVAQREVRDMMRDVRKGESTAGTTGQVFRAESRRKEQEDRIEVVVDNLTNRILAFMNNTVATILKPIADVAERVGEWVDEMLGKEVVVGAGLGAVLEKDAMDAVKKIDDEGKRLMDIAIDAIPLGGGFGVAAPKGGGRFPFPGP